MGCATELTLADKDAQWHRASKALFSVHTTLTQAPEHLPAVTPITTDELSTYVRLASDRAHREVADSETRGPVFAIGANEAQLQHDLASFRFNFKIERPDQDWPSVIGARCGTGEKVSFVLWAYNTSEKGIRVLTLSATNDQATLALVAAAAQASRELGGTSVGIMLSDPGVLRDVIAFGEVTSTMGYSDGTLCIDPKAEGQPIEWLNMGLLDFTPWSGA